MKNTASKLGRREKNYPQKKKNNNNSPRSPLKVRDLNAISSCSSSSSSISTEPPRGCLRFLLSHQHSSSSSSSSTSTTTTTTKNGCKNPKSVVARTPKSAPNVTKLRGNLSIGTPALKNSNNRQNPEKPTSRRIDRLRKRPPQSSRSGVCDKISYGLELKLSHDARNFTPVAKFGCKSGSQNFGGLKLGDEETNNSDSSSPIIPIQASVSPEIQGGSTSMMAAATPSTCYAAGHVLSGVTDKRKCRPRGILTVGDNDLFGSCKTKVFENGDKKEKLPRLSFAPSPVRASIHWFSSSPSNDEKRVEEQHNDGARNELGLNQCGGFSVPFTSVGCSLSPSSSLGFSSELFNRSNSTFTTSEATTTTHSSRRSMSCVLSPESTSKFRGLLGPSFDHLVCSPSPSSSSLISMPFCKVEDSPQQSENRFPHTRETTPLSDDSIGSGNVIQTPTSNSSSPNCGLWDLSKDDISRPWFECELDSLGEALGGVSFSPEPPMSDSPKMSFEFNPLVEHGSSIDFTNAHNDIDKQNNLGFSESLVHDLPKSEIRMSTREGLESYISEINESDCCKCFSDEEDLNNHVDPFESGFCSDLGAIDSYEVAAYSCDPNKMVQQKESIKRTDESFPLGL